MADENKDAALALKAQGNKAFAKHDWDVALDFYTKAIEKYDKDPSFFCNRAQVYSRSSLCLVAVYSGHVFRWFNC